MSSEASFIEVVIVVGVYIVSVLADDAKDRERIAAAVAAHGGLVRRIRWTPFRRWTFTVDYEDRAGVPHRAACTTSEKSGVDWSEDRIVRARVIGNDGRSAPDREVFPIPRVGPAWNREPTMDLGAHGKPSSGHDVSPYVADDADVLRWRLVELERLRRSGA